MRGGHGGVHFFQRREIKDVLALIWYLADPMSDLRAAAFLRSRFVRLSDAALQTLDRAAERAVLKVLTDAYPQALTAEEVAERAGYEAAGGGFRNALGKLRTLELITGRGELRASEELFS